MNVTRFESDEVWEIQTQETFHIEITTDTSFSKQIEYFQFGNQANIVYTVP